MLWFGLAILLALAIGVYFGVDKRDLGDGVGGFFVTLFLAGLVALFINGFMTDVGEKREVTKACNLAPITAGSNSMAAVSGDTFYYRCEGNSDFAPSETDSYSDEVRVYGSERAHVVIEKDVRHNYFWSVFNDEEVKVKIYVPNNLLATSLDNAAVK